MNCASDKYHLLIESLPDAFAYYQVLADEDGKPVNYIFLEVNSAFEEMVGLKRNKIVGKNVTEVLPVIGKGEYDWIGTCGKVALSGEPIRFENYSKTLKCWYDVCAYSDEPGYFATVFRDISAEKNKSLANKRSNKGYENIVDNIPDIVVRFDAKLRHIYINRAAERLFGMPADFFMGKTFLDLQKISMFEEQFNQLQSMHKNLKECLESGEEKQDTFTFMLPEGERHLFTRIVPEKEKEGKVISLLTVTTDITEHKQQEETMRKSKEQLEALSNNIPEGMVYQLVVDPNGKRRFTYLSSGVERMHGITPAEVLSNPNILYDQNLEEDLRTLITKEEQAFATLSQFSHEGRYCKPNGEIRWALLQSALRKMPDGTIICDGIELDITERKRAEQELARQKNLVEKIIDSLPDSVVYIFDLMEMRNVYASKNLNEILGYTVEEFQAMGDQVLKLLLHPDDFEPFLSHLHSLDHLGKKGVQTIEYRLKHADGSWTWIENRDTVFALDQSGRPLQTIGTAISINERKEAEEEIRTLNEELEERVKKRTAQLEAANRELDAFTYSASHDLRSPLNRISGFIEALLEDYTDQLDPQGRDYLQRINNSCEHMKLLIDDLLKLSRVSQMQISCEPVELSALVNVCLKELQAREPDRPVEIVIAPGLVADGDTALLRIALDNLLGNAWKFTAGEDKPRIEFGSTIQKGKEVYYIKDNGTGFDMKHAEKLFAAFQRLHDAKIFPGTGVGLSIVSRIINRHGGEIWAEGEEGKGACFCFTLP